MRDSIELERLLPTLLLALTGAAGLLDAVCYLALGHVFTANMTGNIVFLGFAAAGATGLSVARSGLALVAFLAGAVVGGRMASRMSAGPRRRWIIAAFGAEALLLLTSGVLGLDRPSVYAIIVITGIAMGIRNAVVRRLAVPDLTTTVLTLTLTGLAADSSLAGGENPRWGRRVAAASTMLAGAAAGALLVRVSVSLALFACGLVSAACALAAIYAIDPYRTAKQGAS